ncbi:hypothetical protein IC229_25545 [Spirosoma sp. BT702]|uniref:ZU5 domain-containing protein n=1 Tax=Spirosoma profusum TaxID=2771354 RepID=A0A926Y177_9BACT|nr:hypothetical protein [Spirosoma profusum]MBD2704035.1 hypothetical protein [Spirosoma profusum]
MKTITQTPTFTSYVRLISCNTYQSLRSASLLFGLLILLSLASCKKTIDVVTLGQPGNVPTQNQNRPGQVYPVGKTLETPITTTIGPAGGMLTSADKRLTINVPAGAVETAQQFSIQPISSTGPQSLGNAFRLSPHGVTFKKPVTLRVTYDPATLSGTVAEVLALAYQNEKGIWMLAAKGKVDTVAHTVSVETTHFSDWAILERAKLLPEIGFVKPGEKLGLEVMVLDDNLLVPMTTDTEVPAPYQSPTQLVDVSSWKLAGLGTLTPAIWKASYLAPATVPARNPVAVSIKLNGPTTIDGKPFGELWLVSTIYVGEEGLMYRINGGKWVHTISPQGVQVLNTPAGKLLNMNSGITADGNNLGVTIQSLQPPVESDELSMITYSGMNMPWTPDGSGAMFNLADAKARTNYKHFYHVGKVVYPSPGGITFYQFGKAGGYVIGKFEIGKGEGFNEQGSVGTVRIEGHFRIKRAN